MPTGLTTRKENKTHCSASQLSSATHNPRSGPRVLGLAPTRSSWSDFSTSQQSLATSNQRNGPGVWGMPPKSSFQLTERSLNCSEGFLLTNNRTKYILGDIEWRDISLL